MDSQGMYRMRVVCYPLPFGYERQVASSLEQQVAVIDCTGTDYGLEVWFWAIDMDAQAVVQVLDTTLNELGISLLEANLEQQVHDRRASILGGVLGGLVAAGIGARSVGRLGGVLGLVAGAVAGASAGEAAAGTRYVGVGRYRKDGYGGLQPVI